MSEPLPDYRDLVGRLDFARTTGLNVTFSPQEAWLLREHIRALASTPTDTLGYPLFPPVRSPSRTEKP